LAAFAEVDDVAVVSVGGARVYLFAADVREYHLPIVRVAGEEVLHFGDRRGDALRVSVIEGEPHSEDDAALKALVSIEGESCRVVVPTTAEEKRINPFALPAIEVPCPLEVPFRDVAHAHHYRRCAGPFDASSGSEDIPSVSADPTETSRASVPLGDGVGGDQAEGPALAQPIEGTAEEMSDEVGIAMALLVRLFQPAWALRDAPP